MDGPFSRKINIKDQYLVFTNDLDKDISSKISMFAVGIKLFPEVKHQAEEFRLEKDLGNVCGWAKHSNPAGCSFPSVSVSPERRPGTASSALALGPKPCNQRAFKESSPASWASTSGLPSFQVPVAIWALL